MEKLESDVEQVLKVIDLFSGAGGLSFGVLGTHARATVDAVELNKDAAKTYAANFPNAAVHICSVQDYISNNLKGSADLVIGGPPCQGFSSLGSRNDEDARNQLWRDFMEVVFASDAKFFIMENVPNFLKSREYQELSQLLARDGRFEHSARVLNSAHFGGAQGRKRAFVVGWRCGTSAFPWPEPQSSSKTLRDVIFNLPEAQTPEAWDKSPGPRSGLELHVAGNYSDVYLERFSYIPEGGSRKNLPEHLLLDCWKKPGSGFADVMGRLRWDSPSVTIRTEFHRPEKGRHLHPTQNRTLTHLEASLIQGFPIEYKFVGTKTSVARQIGNAVPKALGEALGESLSKLLTD